LLQNKKDTKNKKQGHKKQGYKQIPILKLKKSNRLNIEY